MPNLLIIAK